MLAPPCDADGSTSGGSGDEARRRVATVELALLPEDGPLALAFSTTASELVVSTRGGAVVALALADLLEP